MFAEKEHINCLKMDLYNLKYYRTHRDRHFYKKGYKHGYADATDDYKDDIDRRRYLRKLDRYDYDYLYDWKYRYNCDLLDLPICDYDYDYVKPCIRYVSPCVRDLSPCYRTTCCDRLKRSTLRKRILKEKALDDLYLSRALTARSLRTSLL